MVTRELPDGPNNVAVVEQKETLPLAFQVEAGAYINAIRSSLDILAVTLANRHCRALVDAAYFPVAKSAAFFAAGQYKGAKFVRALPEKERAVIEFLRPYKGGNNLLYPLHNLDIVRKHQRLLGVEVQPQMFIVSGWGDTVNAFTPVARGWIRSGQDEIVIGFVAKNAAEKSCIRLTTQVSLGEPAYLPYREVITTLYDFARMAKAIIQEFE